MERSKFGLLSDQLNKAFITIFCSHTFASLQTVYKVKFFFLQTAKDARRWMSHFDPKLGVQLPEQDYGGTCIIYDTNNTENPWHNVWVYLFLIMNYSISN